MMPDTATHIADTREALTSRSNAILRGDTPSDPAVRPPKASTFKSRLKKKNIPNPRATAAAVNPVSAQVLEAKLPINQKMMMLTCSSGHVFDEADPGRQDCGDDDPGKDQIPRREVARCWP